MTFCHKTVLTNMTVCHIMKIQNIFEVDVMKKLISLLVLLIMMISIAGCGNQSSTTKNEVESEATTSVVQEEEAPEETVSVESKEEIAEIWTKTYYVDEFDQPTDEWYVCNTTKFLGKFSNSATTDSALYADVVIDDKDIAIFLYEYARSNSVKNNMSSDEAYVIKVKAKDGTVYDMQGHINADGGDRVFIEDAYKDQFKSLLKGNESFSVYLETNKYTMSTYLFEVTPGNFKEVY